jgi:acetoin utilization deacetylase AcuC-like enzyme
MRRIGFVYDRLFLEHRTPAGHPERPERLSAVIEHLQRTGFWDRLYHLAPRPGTVDDLARVHSREYIAFVRETCRAGGGVLDEGDTHVSSLSYDAALLAAGGIITAIDALLDGEVDGAFCAVRPPGHHAGRERAMGFCLFNTIAVGGAYARERRGVGRVAIVDWDVHHGNGTQQIFEQDGSVLFISVHQYPFYPGTGGASEGGKGPGEGATINIPLPEGSDENSYREVFEAQIIPAVEKFAPGLLLISAGFDAHREDPLAGMRLEDRSYALFTSELCTLAPTVSLLEGGYHPGALARSVEAHLGALLGMS